MVTLKYVGKVPTLVRSDEMGDKFDVVPEETFECTEKQSKNYMNTGMFEPVVETGKKKEAGKRDVEVQVAPKPAESAPTSKRKK